MTVTYTDPALITDAKITDAPRSNTVAGTMGYGPKVPTRYMLRYARRWQRVYMMQYSNSGTPYIIRGGEDLILDLTTRHTLEALVEGGRTTDPQEES